MASDKAIVQYLLTGSDYGTDQRKDMAKFLVGAVKLGRADERRRFLKSLGEQRDMIRQKRKLLSPEERMERFKLLQSIRTIDAMMKLISEGEG